MKTIKTIIITTFVLFFSGQWAIAQQEPLYTHYMFNPLSINPGYAGSSNGFDATLLHRSQWLGMEGAPTTQALTAHTPLTLPGVGVGGAIINDQAGPLKSTALHLDAAYHITISPTTRIGLGLKTSFDFWRADLANLTATDPDDPLTATGNSQLFANIGFGALLNSKRYSIGIAVPKLMKNSKRSGNPIDFGRRVPHYFLTLSYNWKINTNIEFRPTVILKAVQGAPLKTDITLQWLLYEKYSAGLMYRTGSDIGILVQYWITKKLRMGYAFDYGLNDLNEFHQGSHELALTFRVPTLDIVMRPPRSF